jgi:hypothetical protein
MPWANYFGLSEVKGVAGALAEFAVEDISQSSPNTVHLSKTI